MPQLKIMLTGYFGGKVIDSKTTINTNSPPTLRSLLKTLNQQYNISDLNPDGMDKRDFVVMINDNQWDISDLDKTIPDNAEIAIIQPLAAA